MGAQSGNNHGDPPGLYDDKPILCGADDFTGGAQTTYGVNYSIFDPFIRKDSETITFDDRRKIADNSAGNCANSATQCCQADPYPCPSTTTCYYMETYRWGSNLQMTATIDADDWFAIELRSTTGTCAPELPYNSNAEIYFWLYDKYGNLIDSEQKLDQPGMVKFCDWKYNHFNLGGNKQCDAGSRCYRGTTPNLYFDDVIIIDHNLLPEGTNTIADTYFNKLYEPTNAPTITGVNIN